MNFDLGIRVVVLFLVITLFGCGGKSTTQASYVESKETIGAFHSGMSFNDVQTALNKEGKPMFKALYGDSSYVLLHYKFKRFRESYVFVFKDLILNAIMDEKVFTEAWDNTLSRGAKKDLIPFEEGIPALYDELVKMNDKITYGDFQNISISHSRMVPEKVSRTSEAASLLVLSAIVLPAAAPAALITIILEPLRQMTVNRTEEMSDSIKKLNIGDSLHELEVLNITEKNLLDARSENSDYVVYMYAVTNKENDVIGFFGLRKGKVEWISTFGSRLMYQEFYSNRVLRFW